MGGETSEPEQTFLPGFCSPAEAREVVANAQPVNVQNTQNENKGKLKEKQRKRRKMVTGGKGSIVTRKQEGKKERNTERKNTRKKEEIKTDRKKKGRKQENKEKKEGINEERAHSRSTKQKVNTTIHKCTPFHHPLFG